VDPIGAGVLAVALALTAVGAWWLRRRDGAVRGADGGRERSATAVLEDLGVRPGDAELTVVQFSTAFCGPCRATRARLQQLQATRPGLAHVDVDAESHLDAVRELGSGARRRCSTWIARAGCSAAAAVLRGPTSSPRWSRRT
jgi:hypothetical protein